MSLLLERPNVLYSNESSVFQTTHIDYSYQYFNIYLKRLDQLRDILATKILLKWRDMYPLVKLRDISESHYDSCIVIGTIFKDQKLKPSVLKQLAEAEQLVPQPVVRGKFLTDESDRLFLEDEGQRYQLDGLDASKLVTGVTIAVLGEEAGLGKFKVEDFCFAGLDNYVDRPLFDNKDCYVLFLSGLDIANSLDALLPLKVLTEWISGSLGDIQGVHYANISRVVIVGNSINCRNDLDAKKSGLITEQLDHIKTLDRLLLEFAQVIDIDIMPGQNDPTSYVLPQRPLHNCLLPLASPYKSLSRVSNPYAFSISSNEPSEVKQTLRLLGTSGSPVRDVIQYSGGLETALGAMEGCLKWGHIAPTAPDTLGCYPFHDKDPFIIEKAPHVFFAGNQEAFQTKECDIDGKQVRLIAIPEFSKTREVCVLNLKNLECFAISFDVII